MKKPILLLCLFAAAALFGQSAKGNPVIAVSDFEGRGLAEGEAVTLTDAFRSYLINTEAFRMMERSKMDEVLKEQGFQNSGACSDQACIVEMGQLLGVDNIVAGSVGKVGGTFSVNVRFVSVATGEIKKVVNQFYKGQIDGLLTEVLPKIADELARLSRAASAPAGTVAPAPVPAPAPAVTTAAPAPEPAKETPPEKEKDIKAGGGGSKVPLIIGVAVLVAAGAGAAWWFTQQADDEPAAAESTGEVTITWD